jgi:hypothetical protein
LASRKVKMWIALSLGVVLAATFFSLELEPWIEMILGFISGFCFGQANTEYNRMKKEEREELMNKYQITDPNKKGGKTSEV